MSKTSGQRDSRCELYGTRTKATFFTFWFCSFVAPWRPFRLDNTARTSISKWWRFWFGVNRDSPCISLSVWPVSRSRFTKKKRRRRKKKTRHLGQSRETVKITLFGSSSLSHRREYSCKFFCSILMAWTYWSIHVNQEMFFFLFFFPTHYIRKASALICVKVFAGKKRNKKKIKTLSSSLAARPPFLRPPTARTVTHEETAFTQAAGLFCFSLPAFFFSLLFSCLCLFI